MCRSSSCGSGWPLAAAAVVAWCLLCLPGNAVTLYMHFFIGGQELQQQQQQQQGNFSVGQVHQEQHDQIDPLTNDVNQLEDVASLANKTNQHELTKSWTNETNQHDNLLRSISNEEVLKTEKQHEDEEEAPDCHELLAEWADFLSSAKYWLHGWALCVVGTLGLAGNMLAFVVLGRRGTAADPFRG